MQIINGLMLVIALAGVVLNVKKYWQGFLLWMVSNGYWAWYFWRLDETAAALQFTAFAGLCIYGMFAWRQRRAKSITKTKLSELTYHGNVNDATTISELRRRLKSANIITARLLDKLNSKRRK